MSSRCHGSPCWRCSLQFPFCAFESRDMLVYTEAGYEGSVPTVIDTDNSFSMFVSSVSSCLSAEGIKAFILAMLSVVNANCQLTTLHIWGFIMKYALYSPYNSVYFFENKSRPKKLYLDHGKTDANIYYAISSSCKTMQIVDISTVCQTNDDNNELMNESGIQKRKWSESEEFLSLLALGVLISSSFAHVPVNNLIGPEYIYGHFIANFTISKWGKINKINAISKLKK